MHNERLGSSMCYLLSLCWMLPYFLILGFGLCHSFALWILTFDIHKYVMMLYPVHEALEVVQGFVYSSGGDQNPNGQKRKTKGDRGGFENLL